MTGWIRDVLACRRAVREVDEMSERDLHELGLSRGEARAFARIPPEVTTQVERMASVYGLTAGEIKRGIGLPGYRERVAACATCGRTGECRDRLQDAANLSPGDVTFCPNAMAFAQLASRPSTWRRILA